MVFSIVLPNNARVVESGKSEMPGTKIGIWTRLEDSPPEKGTTLIRNPIFNERGDFEIDAITIVPENRIGGFDNVFLISSGELSILKENLKSALGSIGLGYHGGSEILRANTEAQKPDRIARDSPEGLYELSWAANWHQSVVHDSDRHVVQIGLPKKNDIKPVYQGEIAFYPENTSLYAVLRNIYNWFHDAPEDNPQKATPYDLNTGPYVGLSRDMKTRADLFDIAGFQGLERDNLGHPVVFDDNGNWIGPSEDGLIALWHNLSNTEIAEFASSPDF